MDERITPENLPKGMLDEDPEITYRQASYNRDLRYRAESEPSQADASTLKFGPLIAAALLGGLLLLTAIYQMLNPQTASVPDHGVPAPAVSAPSGTPGLVSDEEASSKPAAAEHDNGSSL